jgi:hypothetical protein
MLEGLEDRTTPSTSIPLSPANWADIGPAALNKSQIPGAGLSSGRVAGVAADPTNANIIYAATAGGGVWKTTNAGGSWVPLTDNLTDPSGVPIVEFMGAISVAPSNPQVIYAGTGEADNSGDSFYGDGILISRDGGQTWTLTGESQFSGLAVSQIAIDPKDPNTAYAAIGSAANGNPLAQTGIYKTTDGGVTWVNILTGQINPITGTPWSTSDTYSAVIIDPQTTGNAAHVLFADGTPTGSFQNGVYGSADGGLTFGLVLELPFGNDGTTVPHQDADDPGRIALAWSRPAPNTLGNVYASISDATGAALMEVGVSKDGGAGWTDVTPNLNGDDFLNPQGFYDNAVIADPLHPNTVVVGGALANQGPTFNGGGIVESQDAGVTWTNGVSHPDINTGNGGTGPHTDVHGFTFDANDRLVVGTDGGVWRLDANNVATNAIKWTDINSNMETIQFDGIALDPTNPNVAYGASQDNGTEKFTDNKVWTHIDFGDGGRVLVDPHNPMIIYHTFPFGPGFVAKSTDGGNTWTDITPPINFADEESNFYTPMIMDPSNSQHLIIGTDNIWETTDGGQSWAELPPPPTSDDFADKPDFANPIDSLGFAQDTADPSRSVHIFGSAGGTFFSTLNGGITWNTSPLAVPPQHPNDPFSPPSLSLDIATDSNDPLGLTVYTIANDWKGGQHVFASTDGGADFTDITGNLPDVPADSVIVVHNPNMVVVGTDVGVYATLLPNGANTKWFRLGGNMPNAMVLQMAYDPAHNILAAGTHGRGMFEILIEPTFHITTITPPGNLTEGTSTGNLTVATFLTNAANPQASQYTATVNWGDGTSSTITSAGGGIVSNGGGSFSVIASHTYNEEGTALPFSVTVNGPNSLSDNQSATTGTIADAALTGTSEVANGTQGQPLNNALVAQFTDTDPNNEAATNYSATITWTDSGGGTHVTSGSIVGIGGNVFQVFGTSPFSYAAGGSFAISVVVSDVGGASKTISSTANITIPNVIVSPATVNGTEGQASGTQTVATFVDPGSLTPNIANYAATVTYIIDPQGDTATAAAVVTSAGGQNFNVVANLSAAFTEEGSFPIQVTVTKTGLSGVTTSSTALIADAALTGTGTTLPSVAEGSTFVGVLLGSFTDTDPTNTANDPQGTISDYTATITWDDGGSTHTSIGTIVPVSGNTFQVFGDDTVPVSAGTRTESITVSDGGTSVTFKSTLQVTEGQISAQGGGPVTAGEGQTFNAVLGTFTDPDPNTPANQNNNTVVIDWGDGTTSSGTVVPTGVGQFNVTGSHAYHETGNYNIHFTVTDATGLASASGNTTATVVESPMNLAGINPPQNLILGQAVINFPVATFTDANPFDPVSAYAAIINWGDGTTSGGTIQSNGNGSFTVLGSHTYGPGSTFTMSVSITEDGGQSVSGSGTVTAGFIPQFGGNAFSPAPSTGLGFFSPDFFASFFALFEQELAFFFSELSSFSFFL